MLIGVTGASGHVGNVVCRTLLEQGHEVRAFYRTDDTAIQGLNVTAIQGDVLNKEDVKAFVSGCEVVVHCAAIISIYGDPTGIVYKTNVQGPENVLNASIEAGVKKIVHLSSTHAVMENPRNEPCDESREYKQKENFAYDYSKAQGEQLMLKAFREGKIEGCVVRPSSVVGIHDYKPSEFGKALIDFYNRKIPMIPQGGYNFVDVRDMVNSVIAAIDKGRNGEVYFACGKYHTVKEVAVIVNKVTGIKTPRTVMPFWFLRAVLPFIKLYSKIKKAAPLFTIEAITALKLGHPNIVTTKAETELGHQHRALESTIADFYEWQIEQGRLTKK